MIGFRPTFGLKIIQAMRIGLRCLLLHYGGYGSTWRNNRCFGRVVDIPPDQLGFIMAQVGIILKAMNQDDRSVGAWRSAKKGGSVC